MRILSLEAYQRIMLSPRKASLIGLGAIPAILAYIIFTPDIIVTIALVNVVLITISLYIAFSPTDNSVHTTTH